ncbi:MAG: VOC family protein [Candidatus Sumerlaeaceae bacterium]|nr:VOC family protein [Candidatus Sumerlaeaceae bacterium]
MITRLAHACMLSSNLEATERFYCAALGMKRRFEFRRGDDVFGFYLDAGGTTFLEVFRGDPNGVEGRIRHWCFEVEDLDATRQSLIDHGFSPTEKILPLDHTWQFWCKDPDGIDVEFQQYTPDSLQLRGGIVQKGKE